MGMGRRPVARPMSGMSGMSGTGRHHQQQPALQPAPTRGADPSPADLSQTPSRSRMPTYADFAYSDTSSFQGGSLQPDELAPYSPDFSRQTQSQSLREQHRQQQQQQQQQQVQQTFTPYGPDMVYNLNAPGQAAAGQAPYEVVPQYPGRQSAAIEALSSPFAVPQYFPPPELPGSGGVPGVVSPYLTPQMPSAAYNQPGPVGRSSAQQPFPGSMADFKPVSAARLEQSPLQQQQVAAGASAGPESINLSEAYGQFQQALRGTFEHTRAGRLVEAGRSTLEISEWLVTNARELGIQALSITSSRETNDAMTGILRDDQLLYADRLQLWNDFNICWLSLCQKQKDLTADLLLGHGHGHGHLLPHMSLLSADMMEDMGRELISLCDKIEQHGLVDYQMGIWEEEILSGMSCRSPYGSGYANW